MIGFTVSPSLPALCSISIGSWSLHRFVSFFSHPATAENNPYFPP